MPRQRSPFRRGIEIWGEGWHSGQGPKLTPSTTSLFLICHCMICLMATCIFKCQLGSRKYSHSGTELHCWCFHYFLLAEESFWFWISHRCESKPRLVARPTSHLIIEHTLGERGSRCVCEWVSVKDELECWATKMVLFSSLAKKYSNSLWSFGDPLKLNCV